MGVAELAIRFLVQWAPGDIPRLPDATLDLSSSCFAARVAALAAVACTVIPGWSATRMHLESALREGGTRSSLSRRGLREPGSIFILAQTAVTVILLATASLLVLSYRSMMSADIGFSNRNALSMNLQLRGPGMFSGQGFDAKSRRSFYTQMLSRLRDTPGVTSAAAVLTRPLEGPIGWDVPYEFEFEAGAKDNRVLPKANYEVVTPGLFQDCRHAVARRARLRRSRYGGRGAGSHHQPDTALTQRIRAAEPVPAPVLGCAMGLDRRSLEQSSGRLRGRALQKSHSERRRYFRPVFTSLTANQPCRDPRNGIRAGPRCFGAADVSGDRFQSSYRWCSNDRRAH